MGLFSKKKTKSVSPEGKLKNMSFYLRENQLTNIKELLNLKNLHPQENALVDKTGSEFSVAGIKLSQITPELLLEKLGTPSFVLENQENIPGHKVYYFRAHADLNRLLIQLHFIHDHFFFASNKISATGITLSDHDKKRVLNKIFQKYAINRTAEENLIVYLTDSKGNRLFTSDDVHFYLHYAIPAQQLNEIIKQVKSDIPTEEEHDKFDQTLDQYL
jgi:hypothetical protein